MDPESRPSAAGTAAGSTADAAAEHPADEVADGGAQHPADAVADAAPDGPAEQVPHSAADRVTAQGGSPSMALWVGRVAGWVPALGPTIGFWASAYARFVRHRGSVLAGGLAFFALLSLVPAVISLGTLTTLLIDPDALAARLADVVADHPDTGLLLDPIIRQLSALNHTTVAALGLAGLASVAVSLYAASRFVYVGRQVLDIAFELEAPPASLFTRAVAILVTLLAQLAVALGLVALTLVPRLLDAFGLGQWYGVPAQYLRVPLMIGLVYLVLVAALRFGIHARGVVGWLSPGALVGTAIIVVGTLGLGWFLSRSITYSQIVAALGSVIALEIWLYVIGIAIVFAAEVEAIRHGFPRRGLGGPAAS